MRICALAEIKATLKEVLPTKVMLLDVSKRLPEICVLLGMVMVLSVESVVALVVTVPATGTFCNCRGLVNVREPVEALNCPVAVAPGGRLTVMVLPVDESVNVKGANVAVTAPVELLM